MQKKILIIEDNLKWLNSIKRIAASVSVDAMIFAVTNLRDAYQIAFENSIDLFLIDIILNVQKTGDVSGIEFADNIRRNEKYSFTPIIFFTSLEDPKLKAYSNIHCYSYIEKPFEEEKAKKIIEEALSIPLKKKNEREYIYFRKDGILYGFYINDIIYIESNRHITSVHSIYESTDVSYYSVNSLLNKLDSNLFVQCNRSTIINKGYIRYVDPCNRFVKLRNWNSQIEIGIIIKNKFIREIKND